MRSGNAPSACATATAGCPCSSWWVRVTPRPVAVAGQVVIRPMLTLTATFDHRHADGFQAAEFAQAVQEYCADPAAFEPPTH